MMPSVGTGKGGAEASAGAEVDGLANLVIPIENETQRRASGGKKSRHRNEVFVALHRTPEGDLEQEEVAPRAPLAKKRRSKAKSKAQQQPQQPLVSDEEEPPDEGVAAPDVTKALLLMEKVLNDEDPTNDEEEEEEQPVLVLEETIAEALEDPDEVSLTKIDPPRSRRNSMHKHRRRKSSNATPEGGDDEAPEANDGEGTEAGGEGGTSRASASTLGSHGRGGACSPIVLLEECSQKVSVVSEGHSI